MLDVLLSTELRGICQQRIIRRRARGRRHGRNGRVRAKALHKRRARRHVASRIAPHGRGGGDEGKRGEEEETREEREHDEGMAMVEQSSCLECDGS